MGSPGLPRILCIHAMVSDPGVLLDLAGVPLLDTFLAFHIDFHQSDSVVLSHFS